MQADRHRRGIAEQRRAELVEQVVIGEGLFLELDVRIGLAEGLEEILVVLAQQVGVALEHALIPESQSPLVVERGDLAAIGRRVEILVCPQWSAHIPATTCSGRPAAQPAPMSTSAMPSEQWTTVPRRTAPPSVILVIGILQVLPCRSAPRRAVLARSTAGDASFCFMYPLDRFVRFQIVDCVSTRLDRTLFAEAVRDIGQRVY